MAQHEGIHAMRKFLAMALLGERFISALEALEEPDQANALDTPALDTPAHIVDQLDQRGWRLHMGDEAVGISEKDEEQKQDAWEALWAHGVPQLSLATSIDPKDIQFFLDEGFVSSVSKDGSTLQLDSDGVAMAVGLFQLFSDTVDKEFGTRFSTSFATSRDSVSSAPVRAFRFSVELEDCNCYRELIVPTYFTFKDFHEVIQASFLWQDYHLWDFMLRTRGDQVLITEPDPYYGFDPGFYEDFTSDTLYDANRVYLSDIFPRTKKATYHYDYGDGWTHSLRLKETIDAYDGTYPLCVAGEGDAPPEDVGGPYGFIDFKEILKGPMDAQRKDLEEWADDQGYVSFDLDRVNERIRLWCQTNKDRE